MTEKEIEKRRKEMGEALAHLRHVVGVTTYYLRKHHGMRHEVIEAIEKGEKAYSIDSLIRYLEGVGVVARWARRRGGRRGRVGSGGSGGPGGVAEGVGGIP